MGWPLITPALPASEIPLINQYYLHTSRPTCDPTMVWGTEIETRGLKRYLRRVNRHSGTLISPAHVLVRAVGSALCRHPQFNCRVLGRRIYRFREVNVLMPLQKAGQREVGICLLKNVDSRPLSDIAEELWRHTRDAARGEFAYDKQQQVFRRLPHVVAGWALRALLWATNRLNRPTDAFSEPLRSAPALVNYLGFHGAPPMRSFKPSRFPSECFTLNITLGPSEQRAIAQDDQVVARSVAPLFVRADHRIVDAYELGQFVATLRGLISDPLQLDPIEARRTRPTGGHRPRGGPAGTARRVVRYPAVPESANRNSAADGRVTLGSHCRWPRQTAEGNEIRPASHQRSVSQI